MTDLYTLSAKNFERVLAATINVLKKARSHFQATGVDADALLEYRLTDDMLPLSFQIKSVRHHSLNAVKGLLSGRFSPPTSSDETTFEEWIEALEIALIELNKIDEPSINARANTLVTFSMKNLELPFTAENFAMSFSLPNLHFHATTVYDVLRLHGVALGKIDYMGAMAVGSPTGQ